MPLHDRYAQRLLDALSREPLDGFDLYLTQSSTLTVEAEEGRVGTFKEAQTAGVSLRVLRANHVGFSYATALEADDEAIGRLVRNAIDAAKVMDPEPLFALAVPPAGPLPSVRSFDRTVEMRSRQEKIDTALALEEASRRCDPRIRTTRSATYRESIGHARLIVSSGIDVEHRTTNCGLSLLAVATEGGQSEMGWEQDASPFFERLDPWRLGRQAAERAIAQLGGRPAATMKCPVIFESPVAAELLDVLSGSVLYENVHKKKSGLIGRLGKPVAAECLTLIDDGLRDGSSYASPFDGEGTPGRTTTVIDRGILNSYLYDLLNARRDPDRRGGSTGNCLRGAVTSPPGCGTRDFHIAPGSDDLEALVAGVDRGLLITEVMGIHTANPITGEFSVGASGLWIEGGRRRHPVKNFAVAGSLFDVLRDIEAVGSDLRFYGSTGAPSLRVRQLSVSGA